MQIVLSYRKYTTRKKILFYVYDKRSYPDGNEAFIKEASEITAYEGLDYQKSGFDIFDEIRVSSQEEADEYLHMYKSDCERAFKKK